LRNSAALQTSTGYIPVADKKHKRRRKNFDAEFTANDLKLEASDEEIPMDICEPEQLEDPTNEPKKLTQYSRRHRSECDEANLENDEQGGLTIYIDNLPQSADQITEMMVEVAKRIREEEERWLLQE
jgi:hypothetical protein